MSLTMRAAWISLARACRSPDDKDLVSTRIVVGANREIMRFSSASPGTLAAAGLGTSARQAAQKRPVTAVSKSIFSANIPPLAATQQQNQSPELFMIAGLECTIRGQGCRILTSSIAESKAMKSVVLLSVIFALAPMSVLTAATPADTKSDTVVEEIIARVDNHIITHSDYTRSQEQVRSEAQQQGMPSQELGEREKDVLRDLIDQQLLVEKGAEDGITGDTDLVKKLDEIRKQMGLGSMEELEKSAQAQGISYEDFKQNMRNNIVTQQVIQREVGSQIRVSKEEAQKFYNEHRSELERPEQVRLSEILVSTAAKSAPKADSSKPGPSSEATPASSVPEVPEEERVAQAEAKASQLLAEIRKGAKFDEVARKNSDGPSAAQGGDLGLFKRGTLAKELEDTTFAMK